METQQAGRAGIRYQFRRAVVVERTALVGRGGKHRGATWHRPHSRYKVRTRVFLAGEPVVPPGFPSLRRVS
jgi:hypothetical protein